MKDLAKENAARAALGFVRRGMTVGLGTGRTANIFIDLLAECNRRARLGLNCIPTSRQSEARALAAGLRIVGFEDAPCIDLAVDGADVVSSKLYLLKGLGGALGGEKFVAYRARRFVVMVDEGKLRKELAGTVVIETVPFATPAVLREVSRLSKKVLLRTNPAGRPFITDNGNHIVDVHMNVVRPEKVERELNLLPGVVENGIFTRADVVLVGTEDGCRTLKSKRKFSYSPFSRKE
jgi:ribose 5-phosphate isomerase A